jgi:nucleoid-associated protein YgaU
VTGQIAVVDGDSLWTIAASHLGPLASDVEIALEWPRWYQANRAVIGENPDELKPGQLLTHPGAA